MPPSGELARNSFLLASDISHSLLVGILAVAERASDNPIVAPLLIAPCKSLGSFPKPDIVPRPAPTAFPAANIEVSVPAILPAEYASGCALPILENCSLTLPGVYSSPNMPEASSNPLSRSPGVPNASIKPEVMPAPAFDLLYRSIYVFHISDGISGEKKTSVWSTTV